MSAPRAGGECRHHLMGAAAVLGSLVFFVTMNVLTKYLAVAPADPNRPIPPAEKVMYRMIIGVVAILLMVRLGLVKWRFGNIPLLFLRGVLGSAAVLLYFYAIDNTALARASFLLFTYPAWGALFSYVFLGERFGWNRIPGAVLIYLGAAVLLSGRGGAEGALNGDVAGFFCGVCAGAATTTIRALHRYDTTWIIMFVFSFVTAVAGGLVTVGTGSYVAPAGLEWAVLAGIGLSGLGAHALFTTGFRYLDVTTVGAFAMLQAPLSAIAAFILLDEALSALTVAGGLLVLAGGIHLAKTTRARTMERPSQ